MQAQHHIGRPDQASQARLQLVLVSLAAWDLLSFLLELANTRLLHVTGIDGALGARSVSGATAVLAIAYLYAARNPVRHRFVLWLASLEQVIALFASAFHFVRGDIALGEAALPMLVAVFFLVLLVSNTPRQTDVI